VLAFLDFNALKIKSCLPVFITSMPLMFQGTYHESVGISGINYIALGIGVTGASQLNARFMDYMFRRLREKNGGAAEPEYRVREYFSFFSQLNHHGRLVLVNQHRCSPAR
jgi:hypothetical protein